MKDTVFPENLPNSKLYAISPKNIQIGEQRAREGYYTAPFKVV